MGVLLGDGENRSKGSAQANAEQEAHERDQHQSIDNVGHRRTGLLSLNMQLLLGGCARHRRKLAAETSEPKLFTFIMQIC